MRRLLPGLLLVLWTTALPAQAVGQQSTLDAVKAQLDRNPVLRANFQQEKIMQALSRPLLSRGRLIFAAGRGVFWHIEEPVSLEILITPDATVERSGDGSTRRADMSANPLFHVLARAFLAALAGDLAALSEHFDVEPAPAEDGWRLALRPKDKSLASAIAVIGLRGGSFVEEVRIEDARGDVTRIRFSDFRTEPAELDETERAYFAP